MSADDERWLPLHWAAQCGHTAACQLLLEKAPEAATSAISYGWLALHIAAHNGHTASCQLLLDSSPQTATAAANDGRLALHTAAQNGHTATCQLLLGKAPEAATAVDSKGWLPLHCAAQSGHAAICQVLLAMAPESAASGDKDSDMPLHVAAYNGHTATCRLLLERAPEAASVVDKEGITPLQAALDPEEGPSHLDTARCLLAFGPASAVLAALHSTPAALPLFADFVIARPLLTSEEWAAMPTLCPGLGCALPAVLARSTDQARHLVQHLPPADAQRLRTAALSLHRAQTALDRALPAPVVCSILALSFSGSEIDTFSC
jgi:hypothetical protein